MIHPAIDREYFSNIRNGESLTGELPSLLDKAVEALTAFKSAEKDIKADPTQTEAARLLKLDKLFKGRVAPAINAAMESAKSLAHAPMAVEVAKAAKLSHGTDSADLILASEVRAALARMEPDARRALIGEAVAKGDTKTLSAIVSAPAFLSNIGVDEQHVIKETYISQHAPDLAGLSEAARIVATRSEQTTVALAGVRSEFFSDAEERLIVSASARAENAARHTAGHAT